MVTDKKTSQGFSCKNLVNVSNFYIVVPKKTANNFWRTLCLVLKTMKKIQIKCSLDGFSVSMKIVQIICIKTVSDNLIKTIGGPRHRSQWGLEINEKLSPTYRVQSSEESTRTSRRTANIHTSRKVKYTSSRINSNNRKLPSSPLFKDPMKLWFHKTRWITWRRRILENWKERLLGHRSMTWEKFNSSV